MRSTRGQKAKDEVALACIQHQYPPPTVITQLPSDLKQILDNLPKGTAFLGGSRRMYERSLVEQTSGFVTLTEDTDFDYYATYSEENEQYLRANGFEQTSSTFYDLDTEAYVVLKKGPLQICLRRDAQFYRDIFESIPVQLYSTMLWKSGANKPSREQIQSIFNILFAVMRTARG